MGGFARRTSYWNAFTIKYPHKPLLKINGGSIFSDDTPEAPILNRWMLEGTYKSDLDAINLSSWDLPIWQEMSDLASGGQFPVEWMNLPLVSANVRPRVANFPRVRRFIIKDVPIDENSGRHIRVAITGLLSDPEERISRSDFEVEDLEAAARQVLAELEGKADYFVVLTDDTLGKAISLAVNVPGISLLVVAHDYAVANDAQLVGNTLLVVPLNEGRVISEVRLSRDSASSGFRPTARFVPLDRNVPDDPEMAGLQRRAQAQLDESKKGKG